MTRLIAQMDWKEALEGRRRHHKTGEQSGGPATAR